MKVSIIANNQATSQKIAAELREKLQAAHHLLDEKRPELVITVGGDGTLLSAFHRYAHLLNEIRFCGVHTGHLGFYTDWRDYELDELVASICDKPVKSISYPLLDVRVRYRNQLGERHFLALNESTLKLVNSTMIADVYIKDELFENFRGDGLSVATPTGSTGYNKSMGGAVMHPRINALQMTEIASLNNRVYRTLGSPLIIANDEWIEIQLKEAKNYLLTVDQLSLPQGEVESVRYQVATERIHFASFRHTHFWRRVKESFIGYE